MTSEGRAASVDFRLAEYVSLREEINKIIHRGFEVHFAAMTISMALLAYGASSSGLASVFAMLAPILVLAAAFGIIMEQVKTLRRNASYLRVFYEGDETGIRWESDLNRLRKDRQREPRFIRKAITVSDILKGVPNVYDCFAAVCLLAVGARTTTLTGVNFWFAWSVTGAAVAFWLLYIWFKRRPSCRDLVGGGGVEVDYEEEWLLIAATRPVAGVAAPPRARHDMESISWRRRVARAVRRIVRREEAHLELDQFIVRAKKRSHAIAPADKKRKRGGREFVYKEAGWEYRCLRYGLSPVIGEEVVLRDGIVRWGMNFYGHVTSGTVSPGMIDKFLQGVLFDVNKERPFRGPDRYSEGSLEYSNVSAGTLDCFHGVEHVTKGGIEVFRLDYHGGEVGQV